MVFFFSRGGIERQHPFPALSDLLLLLPVCSQRGRVHISLPGATVPWVAESAVRALRRLS